MKTIRRQIYIYQYIRDSYYHGPTELRNKFGIGTRMLQRDLKDLRDCGLLYLKYNKKNDNYEPVDPPTHKPVIKMTERRKKHLARLYRLGTLIYGLTRTGLYELECYESEYDEYFEYKELIKEDPVQFPPEYLGELPDMPRFADTKAEYYRLFPDSNERTRARDFEELTEIGFTVKYSRRYRAFLVGPEMDLDEGRHWKNPRKKS